MSEDPVSPWDLTGGTVLLFLIVLSTAEVSGSLAATTDLYDVSTIEQYIQEKQFEQAESAIQTNIQSDPDNPRWYRLLVEYHLQRNSYTQADQAIQKAKKLGDTSPILHTYRGEVYLGELKVQKALRAFKKGPAIPRNRIGLAEAYVRTGQSRRARVVLEGLKDTPAYADRIVSLRSALGTDYTSRDWFLRRARKGKGFTALWSVGHNDNAALVLEGKEDRLLAGGNPADQFVQARLNGWYLLTVRSNYRITTYGNGDFKDYEDRSTFDLVSLKTGLKYNRAREKGPDLESGGEVQTLRLGNDGYMRSGMIYGLLNQLSYRNLTFHSQYRLYHRSYEERSSPSEDRSGYEHSLLLGTLLSPELAGRSLRLKPTVSVGSQLADGSSSENNYFGLATGFSTYLNQNWHVKMGYRFRHRAYVNPHVRTSFRFSRTDNTYIYFTEFERPLGRWWTVSFRWDRRNNNSNIPLSFSYEQNQYSVTVSYGGE
ncbi:MAG: hypothetical protein ABEK50_15885 [bacterium]